MAPIKPKGSARTKLPAVVASGSPALLPMREYAPHAMPATIMSAALPNGGAVLPGNNRSEEHTSELQSLMRISYAVFCLKKKNQITQTRVINHLYKQEINLS